MNIGLALAILQFLLAVASLVNLHYWRRKELKRLQERAQRSKVRDETSHQTPEKLNDNTQSGNY